MTAVLKPRAGHTDVVGRALALHLDQNRDMPIGLCLYNEDWHQGVIGILASRIKELFHRPVIIFADAGEEDSGERMIKGSARSISQLHIRDALDAVATSHPGLLAKFGGHAMAAGLSLRLSDFEKFSRVFDEVVRRQLCESDLQNIIYSDGELDDDTISMELAEQIRNSGPWGQAFPEPVFDGVFDLEHRRVVGQHHLKLSVRVPGTNATHDAIAFRTTDHDWPETVEQVRLAYKLDVNEYRGFRKVQLLVEHVEPVFD